MPARCFCCDTSALAKRPVGATAVPGQDGHIPRQAPPVQMPPRLSLVSLMPPSAWFLTSSAFSPTF